MYENLLLCGLHNFWALDYNVAMFAHFQKLKIFNIVNCRLSLDDDGTASSSGVSDNEGPKVVKI